jgi:integrase
MNILYKGPFKDHIQNHVELRQAIGYKFDTEAANLKRFDRFTLEKYPEAPVLTKEIVLDWCKKRDYETRANQLARTSVIRQLGKYLNSIEINAYIIPKGYYPKETQYIPYIYSIEELRRFFAETDKCRYCCECPYRHLTMPVFFRMIYTCGLRVSEARLLKVSDVDLDNGIITIRHSKKDKDRLIPMSSFLAERCRNYSTKVHPYPVAEDYYFPALNNKLMTRGNIYHNFRRFLWRAGISHGGRGRGPRIHDFRHTFATHCLKKWAEQGKDLTAYLPVLRTYMGHDSFNETAYYLRLTVDVFADVMQKVEIRYPGIIPALERGINESH